MSKGQLERAVFRILERSLPKALPLNLLIKKLNTNNEVSEIVRTLDKLERDGRIKSYKNKRFKALKRKASKRGTQRIEGVVEVIRSGAAYVVSTDRAKDVYVPMKYLKTALDGDIVLVEISDRRMGRRPEGKIVKILKRKHPAYVGTARLYGGSITVYIDQGGVKTFEVLIPNGYQGEIQDHDKVTVEVTDWREATSKPPIGRILEVLGRAGTSDVEMKAILIEKGFPLQFSKEALEELRHISETIPAKELEKRRDMRGITTFTIDPVDAKDFDDALSIKKIDNGKYEIGVHIADVSHYVQEGTALDKDALVRGNSVYLVDRVLPMLPELLSNQYCSLRPEEDKRCYSVIFEMTEHGKIGRYEIVKTVIRSDKRFSYEEAQEVMDSGKGPFVKELTLLNQLAGRLRKQRFKTGSIDFEMEEVRFLLDENGKPLSLYVKERKAVHKLIEEFMLLANKTVAKHIATAKTGKPIPFVYRVHDLPDPQKVEDFSNFARGLGVPMKTDTPRQIAESYNRLTRLAEEDERLRVLQPLAIRTMSKAIYTTENIGHFGLGFEYYTHFTSPIRRYADLMVHRILEKIKRQERMDIEALNQICVHISERERAAMEAERASVKYKQVEYISEHVGEVFEGRISGIIDRGLFVELIDSLVEGFLPFKTMDEPFEVEESRLTAKGKYSGEVLAMGDHLQVRVVDADLDRRRVEMEWVSQEMDS